MIMPDLVQTPSQTVGPFFGYALPYAGGPDLVPGHDPRAIRLHGRVIDGEGAGVPDAIVEVWQADETGTIPTQLGAFARDGYTFTGFGRTPSDRAGHYSFTTVKPGTTGSSAPHVLVTIFARGVTHHLFTRAYFPEDAAAHATDTVLAAVPADRRPTLIAVADAPGSYLFDIRLQGEGETVFLEFNG
jgi:protocatechuate 3,4-dioxygenase, alpha subunit